VALDLFSRLHINWNGATSNQRGQPTSSLTCSGCIVRQLTHLHAGAEDNEFREVDTLTGQPGPQIIERIADGRRLGDRVARMRRGHHTSVAPCSTVPCPAKRRMVYRPSPDGQKTTVAGVGDPGFEPGTSSLSEKRSNRLS
jgi:hypothetical protein